MKKLLVLFTVPICFFVADLSAAAQTAKPATPVKERLILMPLRVDESDRSRQAAMETALAQGLQQKYEVFSGEQVAQKARSIFLKESRNLGKKECDETRCMQDIAIAFQAELIATANVSKQDDGYFLALSIQNIFDNKTVFSNSIPCQNCNAYQAVEKLKELSNTSVSTAGNTYSDSETVFWAEVKSSQRISDYQAYLAQYPNGKFVSLANGRIKGIQEEQNAESYQKDQKLWLQVQASSDIRLITRFIEKNPGNHFLSAAYEKINALRKAEAELTPGKVFKDCDDCPEMVVVPAGNFDMGSNESRDEEPVHPVSIKSNFALGRTEITQSQWRSIMGDSPSQFSSCGDHCPVEKINWQDAQDFIKKLNEKTGRLYRLPSEAEWEYACRAGGQHRYCGSDDIDSIAWYQDNSTKTTHPVATRKANAFGLHDMSGNLWEWLEDSKHTSYKGAPADGSAWNDAGIKGLIRGGSWSIPAKILRPSYRNWVDPANRNAYIGFRVARTIQSN